MADSKLRSSTTICPHCQADLSYKVGDVTYSRLIGIYDQDKDRTVACRCPDCGKVDERDGR